MFTHPISIALGPFGNLLFLSLNQEKGTSNLYMAQLHNPVQKVEVLKKAVAAKEVHYDSNVVFLTGNHGPVAFHELVKGSVCFDITTLRTRNEVLEKVNKLGLAPTGTVAEMKSRIVNHIATLKRDYEGKGFHSDHINFWDDQDQNCYQFEALHVVDNGLLYGAYMKGHSIHSITLKRDGYGIRGEISLLTKYVALK